MNSSHALSFAHRLAGFAAIGLWLAASAYAGDWPTYMFANTRTGVTSESVSGPLVEQWVFRSPAPPKPAWPVPQPGWTEHPKVKFDDAFYAVADDNAVYFGSSADNSVHALDAKTGASRWTFFTSGPVRLAPTIAGNHLFFGSDDGIVYCVNRADGALVWSFNTTRDATRVIANGKIASLWSVRTSILVENNRVYFGSGVFPPQTAAFALEAATGKLIWKKNEINVFGGFSPQGYLLAIKGGIIFPAGRSGPVCLNRDDGAVVFNTSAAENFKGETTGVYGVVFENLFFCGTQNTLFGINAKGDVASRLSNSLRMVPTADSIYTIQGPPPPQYGRRSITTENNTLTALNRNTASEATTQPATKSAGKRWALKRPGLTSMIVADKKLFAGSDSDVVMLDTQTGKEEWVGKVDASALGLAFAHGRLFVSTAKGSVYCFAVGEPAKPAASIAAAKIDDATIALANAFSRESNITRGYALIVGNGSPALAVALARQTELSITCIELNPAKLQTTRAWIAQSGLYGHRITVEPGKPEAISYPEFAGNLVIQLPGDEQASQQELTRVLKPCGGVLFTPHTIPDSLATAGTVSSATIGSAKFAKVVRGQLPGSGWWTHQYADAGNSGSSGDKLVKGRLGVLWYGEPGGDEAPDRHRRGSAPLVVNGRVFVQGWQFIGSVSSIICYDAYNGFRYWETPVPNALRLELPGVTSNLAVNDDSVFIAAGPSCFQIDAVTGQIKTKFDIPVPEGETPKPKAAWAYVSVVDGLLLGSGTVQGRAPFADSLFAFDLSTGKLRWQQQAREIRNTTIAYGGGRLFFAQNRYGTETVITPPSAKKTPKPKPVVPATKPKSTEDDHDGPDDDDDEVDRLGKTAKAPQVMRTVVALEVATGQQVWEREADLTSCGRWGAGAFGTMQALCKDNMLLFASANTPYGGGPKPEAGPQCGLAISTKDGSTIWSKELANRSRPIFMQNVLLAEPNFVDLKSGEKIMKTIGNKERAWTTGGRAGCGSLSASDSMIFGRSGFTVWSNVAGPGGAGALYGVRPGCMINIIPAGGVVVQAEASSGCACYQAIQATVVLRPVPFDPAPKKK